jgi:hypothetical protein
MKSLTAMIVDWLESEAQAHLTAERESRDFVWRKDRANSTSIALLDDHVLVEPQREGGVYALLVQLLTLRPDLFPFEIIDYDTHSGIVEVFVLRQYLKEMLNIEFRPRTLTETA